MWEGELSRSRSGSCSVAGYGFSGVEPSGYAATVLLIPDLWSV